MSRDGCSTQPVNTKCQLRTMSLVESVANVTVGYGVAVVAQILIFPIFGLHTTLAQNLKMGAIFTIVSTAVAPSPCGGCSKQSGCGSVR